MADSASTDSEFDPENPYGLTQLEQQVIDLLIGGMTSDEVADLLGVERRSIASRRASAMRKYGARNGMHLAHLVEITRRAAAQAAGITVLEDVPSSLSF